MPILVRLSPFLHENFITDLLIVDNARIHQGGAADSMTTGRSRLNDEPS